MPQKLSNEILDQRLIGKNIKRIGDYVNKRTKIEFRCLVEGCNNTWKSLPLNALKKDRCSDCSLLLVSKERLLSSEIVDARLLEKNIKRLEPYLGSKIKIKFQCLISECNNVWKTMPFHLLNYNVGCPMCADTSLTNEVVDVSLFIKNIKRLDNFNNSKTKVRFQCLIEDCNYIWKTSITSILNRTGCPKCAGSLPLTNEIVDQKLTGKNIKRIDNYINNSTKINFQCLNETCNHIWKATTNNILSNNTGCPNCRGFKNEKLVYKILQENNIFFEKQKYLQNINDKETNKYRVDFYFDTIKTIIEYNGAQHYQPTCFHGIPQEIAKANFIKQQMRDKYVEQFCVDNKIKLIVIDGRKYYNEKLEKYLIEEIIPQLNRL